MNNGDAAWKQTRGIGAAAIHDRRLQWLDGALT
jgi:hypothetical protein